MRRMILLLISVVFGCLAFSAAQAETMELRPLTIIGKDDRQPIDNVEDYPYCSVAFMDVICTCGCGWECSGSLIGPDVVLTAAHSLVCTDHAAPAEAVIVYFGYKNYKTYEYRYDGPWTAYVGNMFTNHEYTFENDWGVLFLDEKPGEQIKCLTLNPDTKTDSDQSDNFSIIGYSDGTLYVDQGPLLTVDDARFQYTMDQDFGASGGPILDDGKQVCGIIIGHQEDDDGSQSNIGLTLSSEIMDVCEALIRHAEIDLDYIKFQSPDEWQD